MKMIKYSDFLNKEVRVISVVFFTNGRIIKTEYYGKLIKETKKHIHIIERDGNKINIQKKHVKRVDTNV
jgi:hypothetical protein